MNNVHTSLKTLPALLLVLLGLLPVSSHGAGFTLGPGATPQLQVSNQLAVVNLTETSADVTMYISLEGIPEGKELSTWLWCTFLPVVSAGWRYCSRYG